MANMFDSSLGSIGQVLNQFSNPRPQPVTNQAPTRPDAGASPGETTDYYTQWRGDLARRWGPEAAYGGMARRAVAGRTEEAFRLRDVEQAGMAEAQDNYRQAMADIMQPALSDRDMSDLYAGMLEDIAQQKQRDMMATSEFSGQRNVRGGYASDELAMVELGALGHITRGMRDLRKYQADMASQHKITQLNALGLGAQVLPMVSTLGEQALADLAEFYGGMWGAERGARSAAEAADAANEGAMIGGGLGALGQIGGAALGAFL